jgi:hypothetical protein
VNVQTALALTRGAFSDKGLRRRTPRSPIGWVARRGGFTSKIHLVTVTARGPLPFLAALVSAAQASEMRYFEEVMDKVRIPQARSAERACVPCGWRARKVTAFSSQIREWLLRARTT